MIDSVSKEYNANNLVATFDKNYIKVAYARHKYNTDSTLTETALCKASLQCGDADYSDMLEITEFDETYIKGSVKAPKDCLLYTSIPYNAGWSIIIDGEKVSKENIVTLADSLLAVKLSEGEHTIEFTYSVPGFAGGLVITIFTSGAVILFLLFNALLKKKKKRLKIIAAFPAENDYFSEKIFLPAPEKSAPVEIIESVNLNLIDHTGTGDGPVREVIKPPVKEISREIFTPKK